MTKLHPAGGCIACDNPGRSRTNIAQFLAVSVPAARRRVAQLRAAGDALRDELRRVEVGTPSFAPLQAQMLAAYGQANALAQSILIKEGDARRVAAAHGFEVSA